MITFKEYLETIRLSLDAVHNFTYIFKRDSVDMDTVELMETKLIFDLDSFDGKTGYDILEEIKLYHIDDEDIVETVDDII